MPDSNLEPLNGLSTLVMSFIVQKFVGPTYSKIQEAGLPPSKFMVLLMTSWEVKV